MWAGTDLFCAEVCEGEYPLNWAVNMPPIVRASLNDSALAPGQVRMI
jgi:hypothetical protein